MNGALANETRSNPEATSDDSLHAITEIAARTIGTARASVWLRDERSEDLTCVDLYETKHHRHTYGEVLRARDVPAYAAALREDGEIAAEDAHADPRTAELSARYLAPLGIGATLEAPIRIGPRPIGVLRLEHAGGQRAWTAAERRDAGFLASLAALTLERKHGAMREALLAATLESTGEGILATADTRIVAFNQRFTEMWRIDAAKMSSLDAVRRHIAAQTQLGNLVSSANEVFAGDRDAVDTLELDDGRVFERWSRPQMIDGRAIGRVWSFRDVTVQRRAEAALRASEARMRDLANRDGLTGLLNRRSLLEQLGSAIERAIADGERLCVAMLDLDRFKQINDERGHLTGDAVLRDFARQLRERVRKTDLVGRYGGEEFMAVLRGANAAAARRVLEQIRAGQCDRDFGELPRYTFSAGVAELGADAGELIPLIGCADERLYEAKRAGRDRIA